MKEDVKDYLMGDESGIGVYCGTYKKYNEGSLYGAWLDMEKFSDADEFFEVCAKLHDDEDDPEFMFQDAQGVPDELYHESMGDDEVNAIIGYAHLDEDEQEMLEDYMECFGGDWSDIEELKDKADERSQGKWSSFQEFADEMADEQIACCCPDAPDFLTRYFDYEAFARDLKMDYYEGSNGYIFCCC